MQRLKLSRWLVAVVCVAFSSSAGRGDNEPVGPAPAPVASLIALLSDLDPSARWAATQRLIDLGESARPQLRQALAGAEPEKNSRIDFILMHIQWVFDGDGEDVKKAMAGYADAPPDVRMAVVNAIAQPTAREQSLPLMVADAKPVRWWDAAGMIDRVVGKAAAMIGDNVIPMINNSVAQQAIKGPLLRIVRYDTCPAVRWQAAALLSGYMDNANDPLGHFIDAILAEHPTAAQAYPLPAENAALLALDGWAYRETNPDRAASMMNLATAMEVAKPSAFSGQMDFVFQWLTTRAIDARQYGSAAGLLREQARRGSWDSDVMYYSVLNLFSLHAEYGPFPDLENDLRNYRAYFIRPEMIYALGRWFEREHHPILAEAVNTIALLDGGLSLESHYSSGMFLIQRKWTTEAEREMRFCLWLPGGPSPSVYYRLSILADERDDELAAAHDLEACLKRLTSDNEIFQTANVGWALVQWHYLRAARESHDAEAAKTRLDKLLELDQQVHVLQSDPGMAADVVPALQELGRKDEADRIFTDAYKALAAQVAATPNDPMPKNNFAWLCICSDRHLDEALQAATDAVAMVPEDAGCLDTLAEGYFRIGKAPRALEIETHAVELKPDDQYMKRQVEKYRAAVEKH